MERFSSYHFEFLTFLIIRRNGKGLKRISVQTRFAWPSEETTLPKTLRDWIKSIEFDTEFPLEKPHFCDSWKRPIDDTTICRHFEFLRSNFPPGVISSGRQRTFVILLHRRESTLNRNLPSILRPSLSVPGNGCALRCSFLCRSLFQWFQTRKCSDEILRNFQTYVILNGIWRANIKNGEVSRLSFYDWFFVRPIKF